MALFQWSDDYSVKVPSIDIQHQRLVSMLNELHDGMSKGAGQDQLRKILDGLIEYTAQHFAHEEELFLAHDYAESEQHIAEHQRLVKQVLEFRDRLDNKQASMNMELLRFLKDWLMKHILGSDMRYSKLFVEKRVA